MITGSAPIAAEVLDFMRVVSCCPILEGYGLTETTAGMSATTADETESGHVGYVTKNCEIKLVDVVDMNYTSLDKDVNGNP